MAETKISWWNRLSGMQQRLIIAGFVTLIPIYFVWKVDFIPDGIGGIKGWVDDAFFVFVVAAFITKYTGKRRE